MHQDSVVAVTDVIYVLLYHNTTPRYDFFKNQEARCRVFVSPLATLAFELCVAGDTGLKTGWI